MRVERQTTIANVLHFRSKPVTSDRVIVTRDYTQQGTVYEATSIAPSGMSYKRGTRREVLLDITTTHPRTEFTHRRFLGLVKQTYTTK